MTKIENDYWKNRDAKRQESKAQRARLANYCIAVCAAALCAQLAMLGAIRWNVASSLLTTSFVVNGAFALVSVALYCAHGHMRRAVPWGSDTWTVRDSFGHIALLLLTVSAVWWCFGVAAKANYFVAAFGFGLAAFVQLVTVCLRIMKWCGWQSDTSTSWSRALDRADDFRYADLYGDRSPSLSG